MIELNLERHQDRTLVRSCRSADELLAAIRVRNNIPSLPPDALLFIDEIQESPEAVQWLRTFREDHPKLAVIAAGSLMEVRLQESGLAFPVGRVTFRWLRPLSYFEFCEALGQNVLVEQLWASARELRPPPGAVHQLALELLRDYLLVGGLPEAVARWADAGDPLEARQVQSDLITALADDLNRYRGVRDLAHLEAAYEHLPFHYGLRFKYENFAPGFRSQQMKSALSKLEGAMVITRAWPTSSTRLPLQVRPRSAPKLLPLDVGLAAAFTGIPVNNLRQQPIDGILDGRLAECLVGQQLLTARAGVSEPLCFWVAQSARNNAELDYLIAGPAGLLPLEVKAGAAGTLRSLHQFLSRGGLETAVRLYSGALSSERHQVRLTGPRTLDYRLISLPLYLAEAVHELPL